MRGSKSQRLESAVLAARGEAPVGGLSAADVQFGSLLVEARQLEHDAEPCPRAAMRRAHALFDALPERPWVLLARLVFDSWREVAPAARSLGTERLMRFESGAAAVDVQVGRERMGEDVTIALAVEGGGEGCEARLVLDEGVREETLELDEHGTGSAVLADAKSVVVVIVRDDDGELIRTPPVPLR